MLAEPINKLLNELIKCIFEFSDVIHDQEEKFLGKYRNYDSIKNIYLSSCISSFTYDALNAFAEENLW